MRSQICFVAVLLLGPIASLRSQSIQANTLSGNRPLTLWRANRLDSGTTRLPFTLPHDTTPVAASKPSPEDLTLTTSVNVFADLSSQVSTEGFERRILPRTMESAAGTFDDPSRFLQTLAGVASDNDQRNDFLVRGGNPSENAFIIDNIEIPSINQLALSDTTGGFVSMLDNTAIQRLTLHTDAYDSKFDQRLSSIIEISTRPEHRAESHSILELGIAGLGGSSSRPLGRDGSLFFSARQSILQYVTSDIGMNGVPAYRNGFVRADGRLDNRNTWWGISLTGIDSIGIHPSATDDAETSTFDINYSGWRNTTGLNWQHIFSTRTFAVASIAEAQQSQAVVENDQLLGGATVYDEHSADRITTLKYDWTFEPSSLVSLTAGVHESLDALDYNVQQPIGLQNPYSSDPTPLNAAAMSHNFATGSSAGYIQAAFNLPKGAKLILGDRFMQWSLGGHSFSAPKALVSMPIFGRLAHIGYSEYAQLPPTLYLLSFNNLHNLLPIRSRQLTAGITLVENRRAYITAEVYQKNYSDYPVAANYPQLTMANIADTFGQAFLMFPMVARGTGLARGAELTVDTHLTSRINLTAAVAYARNWYSGLDGRLGRGNFDIPLSVNVSGTWSVGHNMVLSARYNTTSGRPYTPDNLPLSIAQDRDVYDLSNINGMRSASYRRLDFRFEQTRKIRNGFLTWHAGLQNATNHQNFYTELWTPRNGATTPTEQDQMPLFPDGGIKYAF